MAKRIPITAQKNTSIARATGFVAVFTLASRILGLIRDMVTAQFFGAGFATDAFFVAFKVPNLLRRLVAEGSLSTAFVPVLTEELDISEQRGKDAIGGATAFSLALTTVLTAIGIIFAEEITAFFAPGFGAEKTALASSLMKIMFPYVIIVSLLALCSSILNTFGRFSLAAFAPALLNIAMITAVVFATGQHDEPIYVLSYSVLVGGALGLCSQMWQLRRIGFPLQLRAPWKHSAVRKLIRLMLPAVLSASVYQLMVFINSLLASFLDEGSVSWLYYADRLFQFPLGVFSLAIATAALPELSRLASKQDFSGLSLRLTSTLNWVTFITLPATVGLIALSTPLVRAIYEHGSFDRASSVQTSLALSAFAIGLWPISCQSIIVRGYLARKNTGIPAWVSAFSLFINTLLALALMGKAATVANSAFAGKVLALQTRLEIASLSHAGLALAGSIATLLSFSLLLVFLPRIQVTVSLKELMRSFLKYLVPSLIMGVVLVWLDEQIDSYLITLLVGVPIGGLLYFGLTLLQRSPEAIVTLSHAKRLLSK